ncbi:MAG TPA: hypothetical protein VHP34_09555 [Alphaproteobacteria bacterium]|jgi:hypothetical protein|nr:hypothetical protein [Alphaproteobacteria bacterium]
MKKQILMAAVAGFCLMAATAATAEEAPIGAPQPAPITDQLSPEQAEKLEAFKEERKQAFQSLTPEEKQERKQKFKDRRDGFRNRGATGE